MPKPERRSRALRKQKILEATLEVVAELGLSETRITDIAERAGMSSGHVLYYYPSKEAIFLAALEARQKEALARLPEQLPPGLTALGTLRKVLADGAPAGPGDAQWALWLAAWERSARAPEVREVVSLLGARWFEYLERMLIEAQKQGELGAFDTRLAAERLLALHDGLSVSVISTASSITRERMLEILDDEFDRLPKGSGG